ncbi:MAG: ParB N-terminal domain-containing protein, partial [Armatimonadetes bacterium]|nr:ParB N-terminal domain-containing protein [Armatimonadota bacterium]NIM23446.1 ParB N-terminal domain-containing protein [Armatimonadota bacterium]NIM67311.1 ParB N-terminal domain-containing protein [Armatimonadota bacterium]NIM75809.1 ParB N-terminal domain-containing protein [Armatimonadota bacterium]NIN05497.1 ParB N-terminal domain-containing protein [Armatimonadota bacterium]
MVTEVEISHILPHPENSNRMDMKTLSKLRRHIEAAGRYEPLIVRQHPAEKDKFQVINGHNRLQVLRALGHAKARCVIWEVDDDQTRLYLATLNRLSGEDIPERRALLIGNLLERFEVDDLAGLLPESKEQIAELKRFAQIDLDELVPQTPAEPAGAPQVILEFFLDRDDAEQVNLALDVITHRHPEMGGRSEALVHLAHSYLCANQASLVISPDLPPSPA